MKSSDCLRATHSIVGHPKATIASSAATPTHTDMPATILSASKIFRNTVAGSRFPITVMPGRPRASPQAGYLSVTDVGSGRIRGAGHGSATTDGAGQLHTTAVGHPTARVGTGSPFVRAR